MECSKTAGQGDLISLKSVLRSVSVTNPGFPSSRIVLRESPVARCCRPDLAYLNVPRCSARAQSRPRPVTLSGPDEARECVRGGPRPTAAMGMYAGGARPTPQRIHAEGTDRRARIPSSQRPSLRRPDPCTRTRTASSEAKPLLCAGFALERHRPHQHQRTAARAACKRSISTRHAIGIEAISARMISADDESG